MRYRIKPEHNSKNFLRAILESLVQYNSAARLDIANLLYEGYIIAIKTPEKKYSMSTIVLELLSKWVQVLEDLAVLCMMFEASSNSIDPYEIYVRNNNQEVAKFLHRSRKGLPKKNISKIYALKSANEYYKAGKINKTEISYFKKTLDNELIGYQKNLDSMARVYAGRKKGKRIDYGLIVNIYFKTKHNFKIIQVTETSKKLWNFNDEETAIASKVVKLKWGRKVLKVDIFNNFKEEEVKILLARIREWSEKIDEIARVQMKALDDPYWAVPEIRLIKTKDLLKISRKPNRNDLCLCGSGIKFKKCCEPKLN